MPDIYSAVNNAVATISNCADEPIQIPGSVQQHGFLLVINRQSGDIDLCSANTGQYLGLQPAEILSQTYSAILPDALAGLVTGGLINSGADSTVPATITFNNLQFDCFSATAGSNLLVTCIPAEEKPETVYDLFVQTNGLMQLTGGSTTLYRLCDVLAEKIRAIIGYHRVMVYRFDEQDNGHVFAESVAPGVDSYFNLHYPHTDIPVQARQLYLKTLVRIIPDVYYTPVPVVTLKQELAKPEMVDMSGVFLRSVSPIHIQYLKNMGVGATFTISLIKEGRLWGLIACHHNQPKNISHTRQVAAYMLSQILTSQITVQESAEKYTLAQQLEVPLTKLTDYLQRDENFVELHFKNMPELLRLVNATGAALIYNGKIYRSGAVPPDEFITGLQSWLVGQHKTSFSSAELAAVYPAAELYQDTASGVLYHRLNTAEQPALFWFRASVDKVTTWAGNPHEQKQLLQQLTPRTSFEAWKEIKKGSSEKWQQPELDAGLRFGYLLQRHIFYLHQRGEELRYRRLNEQLLKANKELENINWISTHDLKEPLRKIQVFASMVDLPGGMDNISHLKSSIDRIRNAAGRMQRFIDDLLLYSKMSGNDAAYEQLDLNTMLNDVLKQFEEEAAQDLFVLHRPSTLPVIHASRFQIGQLFINLIGNAIKFRKDNGVQQITVDCEVVTGENLNGDGSRSWYKVTVADTGVGFNTTLAEDIFSIFKRAHSDQKFQGTGVGLSICRKIMENHGGKITAAGSENEGAVFTLLFPK